VGGFDFPVCHQSWLRA